MEHYIVINFAPIFALLFLLVLVRTNLQVRERMTRLFHTAALFVVIELLAYNLELVTAGWAQPSMFRVVLSFIGYTMRGFVLSTVAFIVLRDVRISAKVLIIPAVINMLIMGTALFGKVAFSYDANNEFVRGPLGYTTHIISIFYLCLYVYSTVYHLRKKSYYEGAVILLVVLACVWGTAADMWIKGVGLLNSAMCISLLAYYMYFQSQQFKRDALTGTMSRQAFYIDVEKYEKLINAIISIDMNGLKQINDTKGHAYGDISIKAVSECIMETLLRRCTLYRVGGDEFVVLCMKCDETRLQEMVQNMKTAIGKTEHACAIGIAYRQENEKVSDLYMRADQNMYADKEACKKRQG